MKQMAMRVEDIKRVKVVKIVMVIILTISIIVLFSMALVQIFDGPIAYVPAGENQPVAIQVVNKDKTDYEILVPGQKGYEEALEKATYIAVSPDYEPPAKKLKY